MKTLLAAVIVLSFQGAPLDEYYKFKAGTSWAWKRVEDGAERKITAQVTGEEDGKVKLAWKDPGKDGDSTVTFSIVDGILTIEARKEGEAGLVFAVLKS